MLELIQQEAGAVLGVLAILGGLLGGIKLLELLAKQGEGRASH